MSTIYEGTSVRFYTSQAFTSISGTVIDPDVVTFSYQVQGLTQVTFTYTNGTGDPTGTIVRDATGTYHADIDTTGQPGNWVWRWAGAPGSSGLDTTKTKVAVEGNVVISGRAL